MKWIHECLESLRTSSTKVDVVVVDNASTDETVQYIQGNYPEVHLIQSERNLGFGQANNVGMRYALEHKADYVYLLNQDAYVYPDMFEELLKVSENPQYSDYAVFSPLHVHGDKLSLDGQFKEYLKEIGSTIVEDVTMAEMKDVYPVECVPAAGWLLPVKTLHNIGGFDPIFFHYGEDVHYEQRVKYHGYKTGVVPGAKMIHDRNGFGNYQVFRKNMIYRDMQMYIFLDINLNMSLRWQKFIKNYLYFSFDAIKRFAKLDFRMIWEYITSFFTIMGNLMAYRRNRIDNMQKGGHWL